jgi:hypothetical protein
MQDVCREDAMTVVSRAREARRFGGHDEKKEER